jgi:hydrogenase/urease accessory protein HupE
MRHVRAFAGFLYDFVIGDDPLIAVAVVLALGLTAVLADAGTAAWWIMPLAAVGILGVSLHRATRTRSGKDLRG